MKRYSTYSHRNNNCNTHTYFDAAVFRRSSMNKYTFTNSKKGQTLKRFVSGNMGRKSRVGRLDFFLFLFKLKKKLQPLYYTLKLNKNVQKWEDFFQKIL